MPYDRTKTEKAALGEIDESNVVMLGPIEVPYLAFRRSELKRMEANLKDPEGIMNAIYDFANYRHKGTLPREDYDEWVSLEAVMAYYMDNRGGQKKPATPAATAEQVSSSTTGDSSEPS